jgi:hypothetical protein
MLDYQWLTRSAFSFSQVVAYTDEGIRSHEAESRDSSQTPGGSTDIFRCKSVAQLSRMLTANSVFVHDNRPFKGSSMRPIKRLHRASPYPKTSLQHNRHVSSRCL